MKLLFEIFSVKITAILEISRIPSQVRSQRIHMDDVTTVEHKYENPGPDPSQESIPIIELRTEKKESEES